MGVDTSVDLAGLGLANPLLPGSGPPGDSLKKLQRLQEAGIGALVTKTASVARPAVPRPCMAFDGDLFFNVETWSKRPPEEWLEQILPALADRRVPLIQSLGYTPDDLAQLIPRFHPLVDAFELSTHYIGASPAELKAALRQVSALTDRPIFVKLSWHAGDLPALARAAEAGGAAGITAINSVGPVMAIDIDRRASRLGEAAPEAWLSGPAVKPLAVYAVYKIAEAVDLPVIGCGGVTTGRDVIELLLAGATAVQCCTGLIRQGPDLVGELLAEIVSWCADQGVDRLAEIVGTVTPYRARRRA